MLRSLHYVGPVAPPPQKKSCGRVLSHDDDDWRASRYLLLLSLILLCFCFCFLFCYCFSFLRASWIILRYPGVVHRPPGHCASSSGALCNVFRGIVNIVPASTIIVRLLLASSLASSLGLRRCCSGKLLFFFLYISCVFLFHWLTIVFMFRRFFLFHFILLLLFYLLFQSFSGEANCSSVPGRSGGRSLSSGVFLVVRGCSLLSGRRSLFF